MSLSLSLIPPTQGSCTPVIVPDLHLISPAISYFFHPHSTNSGTKSPTEDKDWAEAKMMAFAEMMAMDADERENAVKILSPQLLADWNFYTAFHAPVVADRVRSGSDGGVVKSPRTAARAPPMPDPSLLTASPATQTAAAVAGHRVDSPATATHSPAGAGGASSVSSATVLPTNAAATPAEQSPAPGWTDSPTKGDGDQGLTLAAAGRSHSSGVLHERGAHPHMLSRLRPDGVGSSGGSTPSSPPHHGPSRARPGSTGTK